MNENGAVAVLSATKL